MSSTCVAFSFDRIAASNEEVLKPSASMVVKTLYGLLIRYRDEERLRRGWLGRGGVAKLILVRLKSHRVRVDDLSP